MIDDANDKYVKEMFWPSEWEGRPEGHWSKKNERSWTSQEVVDFLKQECDGIDPGVMSTNRVLLKRPILNEKTKGGLIIPEFMRKNIPQEMTMGKILDWGPDAFRYKRTFPSGRQYQRNDWVLYRIYEQYPWPIEGDHEFELVYVYDEKIIGSLPAMLDSLLVKFG